MKQLNQIHELKNEVQGLNTFPIIFHKKASATTIYFGLCPVRLTTASRMETPQPLWAIYSSFQLPLKCKSKRRFIFEEKKKAQKVI